MKRPIVLGIAVAGCLLLVAGLGYSADDFKSGPQVGALVNAYDVTKVAGPEDGVVAGTTLCYRCKYGNRPVVMVFSRKTDKPLVSLAKQLDEIVAKNEDKQMRSFVTFIGNEDREKLLESVEKFAKEANLKHVPLTVAAEQPNGPDTYSINEKATYTVLIYKGGQVVANHALKEGELSKEKVAAIVKDTGKILN
jgi:hypothetical protein